MRCVRVRCVHVRCVRVWCVRVRCMHVHVRAGLGVLMTADGLVRMRRGAHATGGRVHMHAGEGHAGGRGSACEGGRASGRARECACDGQAVRCGQAMWCGCRRPTDR